MNIQPDLGQNSGPKDTGRRSTESPGIYIREPDRDGAGAGGANTDVREARAHQRRHGDRKAAADRPTD